VNGQLHVPAALLPGKEPPVPIGQEVGWTLETVWTMWRRENSRPYWDSNSDPLVVQPIASSYTDYAFPKPMVTIFKSLHSITQHNPQMGSIWTTLILFKSCSHRATFPIILHVFIYLYLYFTAMSVTQIMKCQMIGR
jgi:hypothetical protein